MAGRIRNHEDAGDAEIGDFRDFKSDRGEKGRRCFVRISTTGIAETSSFNLSCRNTGVSTRLRRMYKPMPTRKMLIRNGMRQPQDISSWSGSFETRLKIAMAASTPIGLPICTMLPSRPR